MRTYRPATIAAMILVLAASLAACSSDSSTTSSATSPSDSAGALGQAIDNVCGKLTDASTAVAAAQAGQTGELSSNAQTLAADLDSAAALLQTLGVDAAPDVEQLSVYNQNLATAAPGVVASAAGAIQTKISDLQTSMACPAPSP